MEDAERSRYLVYLVILKIIISCVADSKSAASTVTPSTSIVMASDADTRQTPSYVSSMIFISSDR